MSAHLSHFVLSTVNSFFPMTTNLHFHLMIGLMKRPILSEQANVFGKGELSILRIKLLQQDKLFSNKCSQLHKIIFFP